MIKITIKTLQKITWLFFIILFINCSQNFEPIIKSITAIPNPAQPNETVILKCIATDDDEENMSGKVAESGLGLEAWLVVEDIETYDL